MKNTFVFTYVLMTVAQMILSNYCHFTPYVMLTILPAMILCLPTKVNTLEAMLIAFATGLAVDWLAEGTLGINALSLVPVAFFRRYLIDAIFGVEPFEQKENLSIKKYGFARMSFAIILFTAIFLVIYIAADCAGTRPLWFMGAMLGFSLLASYMVSILLVNLLSYDDRR
ncbi:MAG: hypothetical protein IJK73_01440 [Bacteroidales bacterium]|nr:hypothetical protein [Bacteroidales bacterium]